MENLLPKIPIFPWLRLGLAYWVLLPFLIRFGVFHALLLFLFRNLITLVYGGQIFSAFLISTVAGILTFSIIAPTGRFLYKRNKIGLIGFSVVLACSFNIVQLVVVNQLLIQHHDFYFQLSPILFWSLISGSLMAFLIFKSQGTLNYLFSLELELPVKKDSGREKGSMVRYCLSLISAVLFFFLIFYVEKLPFQFGFIPALLLINRFRNLTVLLYAWPYYFYLAFLHLFRTEGVYIFGEWITREGLDAFMYYTARTTNIILCGQWIARFLPVLINRYTGNRYLKGVLFALPILPAIFGISISLGRDLIGKIRHREFDNLLEPVVRKLLDEFRQLNNPNPDNPG